MKNAEVRVQEVAEKRVKKPKEMFRLLRLNLVIHLHFDGRYEVP